MTPNLQETIVNILKSKSTTITLLCLAVIGGGLIYAINRYASKNGDTK